MVKAMVISVAELRGRLLELCFEVKVEKLIWLNPKTPFDGSLKYLLLQTADLALLVNQLQSSLPIGKNIFQDYHVILEGFCMVQGKVFSYHSGILIDFYLPG